VDAAVARKLIAGLDAEMDRRWRAVDPSGLYAVCMSLNRLADQIVRSAAGAPRRDDPVVAAEFDELLDMLDELIEKAEMLAAREQDEEAGIEHKVVVVSMVRPRRKEARTLLPKSQQSPRAASRVQSAG